MRWFDGLVGFVYDGEMTGGDDRGIGMHGMNLV